MNPAILPDALISPKPRSLADVEIGETVYVSFTDMKVLSDGSCFLDLEANLRKSTGVNKIQVSRSEDGSFHVVVPSNISYEKGRLIPAPGAKVQPVASITIGPADDSGK
jgi:hypothetical protein